jgi:hypothetical protein
LRSNAPQVHPVNSGKEKGAAELGYPFDLFGSGERI